MARTQDMTGFAVDQTITMKTLKTWHKNHGRVDESLKEFGKRARVHKGETVSGKARRFLSVIRSRAVRSFPPVPAAQSRIAKVRAKAMKQNDKGE